MRRTNYTLTICVMLWVPMASGQQTSAAVPQPVGGSAVFVKMIDSAGPRSDPAEKQPVPAQAISLYHCASWGDPDVYFSDTFAVPQRAGGETIPMIRDAFLKFLQKKYSLPSDDKFWNNRSNGCSTDKDKEVANARQQKRKIIETGWKYDGPIRVEKGH